MATDVTDIVANVLAWCGVASPTPAETAAATLAATSAVDTIKHFRGLGVDDDFETGYTSLATEMAIYAYEKRGVDGTTGYSENGVQRSFEVGSFPPSMLSRITPASKTG